MHYINKNPVGLNPQEIGLKIQKIIGKNKDIRVTTQNNEVIDLEIDDKGLSVSKKKELQEYVDTLKE